MKAIVMGLTAIAFTALFIYHLTFGMGILTIIGLPAILHIHFRMMDKIDNNSNKQ